jgi:hypothetical protein
VAAAFLIAIPLVVAACGSDETTAAGSSPSDTTQSRAQGETQTSDAAYLKAVCTAANDSVGPVISKLAADPSLLSDQKKLVEAIAPALSELTLKLRDIQPPADLKPYHEQVLARFSALAGKATTGQLRGVGDIANLGQGLQPPPDVRDRLRTAANEVPECQQSLLFGSGFFGG